MFAFLGKLFGSASAGEKIIDGVSSGIDKMWYTSEEKADDANQSRREGMAAYMEGIKSTSGSRLARRFIALIITFPWALANFTSMVMDAVGPFINGTETISKIVDGVAIEVIVLASDKWGAAADSLSANASENNSLVGVVLLFYFGGPLAIDGVKGMVTKWTNKSIKPVEQSKIIEENK